MTTLDRLAEDLKIWSSAEFGWVRLAEGHTPATSVLMPQKRNPYALTMVRGEAGVLIGRATGLLALAKSPSARSDQLIFAYGEVPRALDLATRATRLMAGVVAGLEVDAAAMESALRSGFAQAADLAEHLMVTAGLDYRSAYDVVGACVRRAESAGLRGVDLTAAMLAEAATDTGLAPEVLAPALGGDLDMVLDPGAIVRSRGSRGGAEPGVVRGMAARAARGAPSGSSPTSPRGGRAGTTPRPTCGAGRRAWPASGSRTRSSTSSTEEPTDGGPMDIRDQHLDLAAWNALIERSLADPDSEPIENLGPDGTRRSTTRSSSAAARAGGSARPTCAPWAAAP